MLGKVRTQEELADELVCFCVGWVFKAKNFSNWCISGLHIRIYRYLSFQRNLCLSLVKIKESMATIPKTVPTINHLFGVISPAVTWWGDYRAGQLIFLILFKIINSNWNYNLWFLFNQLGRGCAMCNSWRHLHINRSNLS